MKSVLLLVLLSVGTDNSTAISQQPPAARVAVSEAKEMNVSSGTTFVATILPLKRAVIGSAVDGRVALRHVDEGDRVKEGQPLVQLLTNTIEIELRATEAELRLRKNELQELENGFRPNEIEQAKAKMLAAEANTKYARSQRERLLRLKSSEAVAQGDLDQAVAAYDDAVQSYLDMKAAYELIVEGPRIEKIEQARAIVDMQQAQVDQINDRIKKYTIMSRFDGFVVEQYVEIGAWVKTGEPIIEVIELDTVELVAFVAEQHVPHIRRGMEVRVEVPSVANQIFSGVVHSVIPRADPQSRTFPVKIRVNNEITEDGPVLKSGLYARVELPTGELHDAIMIPKDALVLGGPTPVVFRVEDNKAIPVPVELGVAMGSLIQVKGDLKAGQQVVVEGNERLRPNQEVTVVEQK